MLDRNNFPVCSGSGVSRDDSRANTSSNISSRISISTQTGAQTIHQTINQSMTMSPMAVSLLRSSQDSSNNLLRNQNVFSNSVFTDDTTLAISHSNMLKKMPENMPENMSENMSEASEDDAWYQRFWVDDDLNSYVPSNNYFGVSFIDKDDLSIKNFIFVFFIIGKTLDCFSPVPQQLKKLLDRRFAGEHYASLAQCFVGLVILSDICISNGALFLAKSQNRYVEKLNKLLNLLKGNNREFLLDIDVLSKDKFLQRRALARLFASDIEQEAKNGDLNLENRRQVRRYIRNWTQARILASDLENKSLEDEPFDLFVGSLTDSVIIQITSPYKNMRLLYGFFNLSIYFVSVWLKWDSLHGGVDQFFGKYLPSLLIDIVCVCCIGAGSFYDIEPYLKNSDAILSDFLGISDIDPVDELINDRQKYLKVLYLYRLLAFISILSSACYFITIEEDFASQGSDLKLIKASASLYVNICSKVYSLWPFLKSCYSDSNLKVYQFGEQHRVQIETCLFKLLFLLLFVIACFRVIAKSGLSTLETTFEGSSILLNHTSIHVPQTQESFYWSLLLGIPFGLDNMIINWSWKTGPVLEKFRSSLGFCEQSIKKDHNSTIDDEQLQSYLDQQNSQFSEQIYNKIHNDAAGFYGNAGEVAPV